MSSTLDAGMHIFAPSQTWPHQQMPSRLMRHVPVPQHLGSLFNGIPIFCLNDFKKQSRALVKSPLGHIFCFFSMPGKVFCDCSRMLFSIHHKSWFEASGGPAPVISNRWVVEKMISMFLRNQTPIVQVLWTRLQVSFWGGERCGARRACR